MSEVHLTLDNGTTKVVANLFENESISQTFRFTDLQTFGAKGGFSKQFRIPASPDNLTFFGDIFNPNSSGGWFDYRKKIPATLAVNTIPIAIGHLQVKKVISDKTGPRDIECVFFSELPDLATAIGDKMLGDLTDLPNLNHNLDYGIFADSIDGTLEGGNVKYILADRGQKWSEDGTGRPIFNPAIPLYIGELTPMLNQLYIWQQILSDAGFYYEAATLDTELAEMWVPWVNNKHITTVQTPDTAKFKVYLAADDAAAVQGQITGLSELYDIGNNFATDQYTAPYTGNFTISAWITATRTSGATYNYVGIEIRKNGIILESNSQLGESTTKNVSVATTALLTAGDVITVRSLLDADATFTIEGEGTGSETLGTGFKLVSAGYPLQDAVVNMSGSAPKMKQIDFVKAIAAKFNLVIVPDKSSPNKLKFVPGQEFINSGDTLDWTGKLDLDKDVSMYPTTEFQKKNLKWTYKPDGDVLNQLVQDSAGRTYGQIEFGDTGNDFATGEQVTSIEFRPTPCTTVAGTTVIIPKFVNNVGDFFNFGPRSLYIPGTVENIQVYDFDTDDVLATELSLANHYSEYPVGVATNDLNFGQEAPFHEITAVPYNTLYNRFYRAYVRELYGGLGTDDLFDKPVIMEAHFMLTNVDVHKLSFADTIFIKGSYWRLLEVNDFAVGEGSTTRCKLIKKLDVQPECDYTPTANTVYGQIVFEDADGTEVDGSQHCCELFGYTWNSTSGTCHSNGVIIADAPSAPGDSGGGGLIVGMIASMTIDDNITMGATERVVYCDCTLRDVTITLPEARTMRGRVCEAKKIDSSVNVANISPFSGELIDGAAVQTLTTQYEYIRFHSDGKQWHILKG